MLFKTLQIKCKDASCLARPSLLHKALQGVAAAACHGSRGHSSKLTLGTDSPLYLSMKGPLVLTEVTVMWLLLQGADII